MRNELWVDVCSGDGRRRVALVHGFTQSAAVWRPFVDGLGGRFETVALDAPGHGLSAGVEAGLVDGAEMMVTAVRQAGSGGPASWIGYSMGGRYALHVALRHPEAVTSLVLVSATAGIDDAAEREARRRSDADIALRIESEGVERFLAWWLSQPIFSSLPAEAANVEARLGSSAAGLASSLRLAGTGTQQPLWEHLGKLTMPVLVVAGELDAKYNALARRLVASIGDNAELAVVPRAGHACHLESPSAFLKLVEGWLTSL
jgi:2-succinyl-6-hydroxy-2,4-cyclohexadiene-1-carboxylate synthase